MYDIAGKTLTIKRDSHDPVSVLFPGINPFTADQAAHEINTVIGATIAAESVGRLVLTSTITGTASKMQVMGGSAANAFGWLGGERSIGFDSHIDLLAGVGIYEYTDNDGESGYFYEVQYYNTVSGLASNVSTPFQGAAATLINADKLSIARIDLVDARGIAIPQQVFTFYSVHEPLLIDGFQIALNRAPISVETDNAGHAEITLVRGLKVKVVIEGTSLIREIQVPNVASFDLLTLMGQSPDPFSVLIPNFNPAPRRTI
jgi:hypothetical protein